MQLRLPASLHYPITVTELLKKPNDKIERFAPLFSYTYKTVVTEGDDLGNESQVTKTFPTRFESSVEGILSLWKIEENAIIHQPNVVIAEIEEPCSHGVQFGGMCVNCGKDMTESSYNTEQLDSTRATINMVHNNVSLTVSKDEAAKADDEAKRRLLQAKKLSLVVDLDQTIIHATVDPTVGDWQKDQSNPNHDAVKGVRSFLLEDDAPGRPGCWYYIKLRPGLEEFLEKVSQLYELHIYTMGTRAYAKNIADIIDPEHKIFGDRILSRTESGSMTAKNLQRLFPVDTKMVVIIDDRGDVWKWSPNLIKVTPYDFFVGIGDINSSFLPKKPGPKLTPKAASDAAAVKTTNEDQVEIAGPKNSDPETTNETKQVAEAALSANPETPVVSNASPLEQLVAMGGSDDQSTRDAQTSSQNETISKQVKEQPLLQKQRQLEAEDAASEEATAISTEMSPASDELPSQDESNEPERPKHNLLRDDDRELTLLEGSLRSVHTEFFGIYKNQLGAAQGGRLGELRGAQKRKAPSDKSDLDLVPDIKIVLPAVKAKVLAGVVLVFSGVVPLGLDVASTEVGLLALTFGARIDEDVTRHTTHVVAARTGTSKINKAKKRRKTIVTTQWLLDSVAHWSKQDEQQYLLEKGSGTANHLDDDDDPILSESEEPLGDDSEDETDNNSSSRTTPKPGLKLDTNAPSSEADDSEADVDFEGVDSTSPVGGTNDDWNDMNQEIDEFLAEISSDEEGDGAKDNDSIISDTNSVNSRGSIQGRKRGREDNESDADSDQTGVDAGKAKRKKQIHSLGNGLTSLSQTTNVDEEAESDVDGADKIVTSAKVNGDGDAEGVEEEEDDGWDALAEQFQKEMEEAQSDEGGE